MTEYIDVYDRDRRPTGRTVPRQTQLAAGEYRLVVHVCVFDEAGRLLLQKRSLQKSSYGGYWDVSSGGHSRAGERSAQAASRELFEELGIRRDFSGIDPVMSVNFDNGFDDYYVIDIDGTTPLALQADEVDAVKWVFREDVDTMISAGEFIPYHRSFFTLLFDLHENGLDFLRK